MTQKTLRAFLAASMIAMLGGVGAESAVGQQAPKGLSLGELLQGLQSAEGVLICYDPKDPNKQCWGVTPLPSGCTCEPGIKGFVKIDPKGELSIELKGLTTEQKKAIMNQLDKAGSPPSAK